MKAVYHELNLPLIHRVSLLHCCVRHQLFYKEHGRSKKRLVLNTAARAAKGRAVVDQDEKPNIRTNQRGFKQPDPEEETKRGRRGSPKPPSFNLGSKRSSTTNTPKTRQNTLSLKNKKNAKKEER